MGVRTEVYTPSVLYYLIGVGEHKHVKMPLVLSENLMVSSVAFKSTLRGPLYLIFKKKETKTV